MRPKRLAVLFLVLAAIGLLFRSTIAGHARSVLLVSDSFPAIPFKPLSLLTPPPAHQRLQLASAHGPVVADLFLPTTRFGTAAPRTTPAVILSMGVKTQEKDKPLLLGFAATMSRLGYATMWPRLEAIDRGISLLEQPSTFLAAYRYLETVEAVDDARISFVGFSVGSSIALVTATDDRIADRVRSVVFFGGYYDIFDYLGTIATGTTECSGQVVQWRADQGAVTHIREILQETGSTHLLRVLDARNQPEVESIIRSAPERELDNLRHANPSERIDKVKAGTFILHDRGDHYIPYCEAVKLNEALASREQKTLVLVDLFEHVQPGGALTRETIADFARLHWFLANVFQYL